MKLVFLSLILFVLGCGDQSETRIAHVGAPAPAAAFPEVTAENLLEHESLWPYQVELVESVRREGERELSAGLRGVLIRVEPDGLARIDFGRDGLHHVPVAATDIVARANGLRAGERHKRFPNLAHALGPRLLDPSFAQARPFSAERAAEFDRVLCVFANPDTAEFEAIARALAPLRERPGLLTVLLPHGQHLDVEVQQKLRELEWTVPFVYDHLSEMYAKTLFTDGAITPTVSLQSAEGRLLFESPWNDELVAQLTALLDP